MNNRKLPYTRGTIVWDVDDTLCHFMSPVLLELRRIMNKQLYPEQLTNSQWLNDFLTKEELDAFLPYVFNPSFYAELQPTAILAQRLTPEFSALHDKFDFHVVTARRFALGRLAHRITSDWLHDQQVQVDGLTICHPDQPKAQVMPTNTIAVVDDSSAVCVEAAECGAKVFLVDRPWNRHVNEDKYPTMYRVTHENCLAHMARVLL
jgi:uncharacterized HAD superfamily protein